jgi:hypothetical protein
MQCSFGEVRTGMKAVFDFENVAGTRQICRRPRAGGEKVDAKRCF